MRPAGAWRRGLKRVAAAVLPEGMKRRLRAPLYGYRPSEVSLPVEFSDGVDGPRIHVSHAGGAFSLRFREEHRLMIRTHFVDHGAAVEEMAAFISLAATARTFFDIGADLAIFSNVFCALHPGNRAVAYEPSPGRMQSARELTALNGFDGRVQFRSCALQSHAGHAVAGVFSDRTAIVGPPPAGVATIDVDVATVDGEVRALGLIPDLLKIDVEGDEWEVLRGARELLGRKPAISLELHLDLLERRGRSAREVVDDLESFGYAFRSSVGRPLTPTQVAGSMNAILRLTAA